jgi:ABC-type cobalamin transport system ATPase subunit
MAVVALVSLLERGFQLAIFTIAVNDIIDCRLRQGRGGQKVGLVGKNGCGKSTLLSLLKNEISADGGSMTLPWTVAMAWPSLRSLACWSAASSWRYSRSPSMTASQRFFRRLAYAP